MKSVYLNFYGIKVQIESKDEDILILLKKDFSVFVSSSMHKKADFSMQIFNLEPPFNEVPNIVATMQTINSICYDNEGVRYCDYYGDLLVVLDTHHNRAKVYSKKLSKIHEVCYLLILSRVGKIMDLKGLHKLHAFSVSYKNLAIVCMMPMKGGKSTLLMQFLKDERFKIISDDIPLVNLFGEIQPFPLKIGVSDLPANFHVQEPERNVYTMDRGLYGRKQLLCLDGLPEKVESVDKKFKKILLIEGFRYNSKTSILKNSNIADCANGLLKHGVVGVGLPMVFEYFWERGIIDFLRKIKILLFRVIAFNSLLMRSRRMKLFLGKNPQEASEVIIQYAVDNYEKI